MHTGIREGCLYVNGTATAHTVTASAYRQFVEQCARSEVHSVDFSGLQRADSVCIGLLLAALRRPQGAPALRGLPESARELAKLYEIQDFFQEQTSF
ncbi:STAS domain-containing protein [Conchiformibius steedae]|uniref:STAS domain-containing protein n=1 Tax=Conchiformibius steedae TaxID=153493 RepID=A0A3P2A0L1_9NEIS|nr:STAS domain-containing protein [Conchiformibius steedae]RRD88917.1 STAS domain-containing protein [Conchiformibius steedae]